MATITVTPEPKNTVKSILEKSIKRCFGIVDPPLLNCEFKIVMKALENRGFFETVQLPLDVYSVLLIVQAIEELSVLDPEYEELAKRVLVKLTMESLPTLVFSEVMHNIHNRSPKKNLDPIMMKFIEKHADRLNAMINLNNEYLMSMQGYKMALKSYLFIIQSPKSPHSEYFELWQHLLLRVSTFFYCDYHPQEYKDEEGVTQCTVPESEKIPESEVTELRLNLIEESYTYMSLQYMIHATPTLCRAGYAESSMISCFQIDEGKDSSKAVMNGVHYCSDLQAGGGGVSFRAPFRSSDQGFGPNNTKSGGPIPYMKIFDALVKAVTQDRRPASQAHYFYAHRSDIIDLVKCIREDYPEDQRIKNLFLGVSIPRYFIECLNENKPFPLLDPSVNGSPEYHNFDRRGDRALTREYEERIKTGNIIGTIDPMDLLQEIIKTQIERGNPYIFFPDSANAKSNFQHLETKITISNLCAEMAQPMQKDEISTCVLGSTKLTAFWDDEKKVFDWKLHMKVVKMLTMNLNRVIDKNCYPNENAKRFSFRHRSIGIGPQNLAYLLMLMGLSYGSDEANKVVTDLAEARSYAFLEASCEMAKNTTKPYCSFPGSPASQGLFQHNLWKREHPSRQFAEDPGYERSRFYNAEQANINWSVLRQNVIKYGIVNSTGLAGMPTKSTCLLIGSISEASEAMASNFFTEQSRTGRGTVTNPLLVKYLRDRGYWNQLMASLIQESNGSMEKLEWNRCNPAIQPEDIEYIIRVFHTSIDPSFSNRAMLRLQAAQGCHTCMSQSTNVRYKPGAGIKEIADTIVYAHNLGLKTGSYYTTVPAVEGAEPEKLDNFSIVRKTSSYNASDCNGACS